MVMWERTLTVYADVPDSWLDFESQDSDTDRETAWADLREDVRKAIEARFPAHHSGPRPTFDVDWEDKPERKEGK